MPTSSTYRVRGINNKNALCLFLHSEICKMESGSAVSLWSGFTFVRGNPQVCFWRRAGSCRFQSGLHVRPSTLINADLFTPHRDSSPSHPNYQLLMQTYEHHIPPSLRHPLQTLHPSVSLCQPSIPTTPRSVTSHISLPNPPLSLYNPLQILHTLSPPLTLNKTIGVE